MGLSALDLPPVQIAQLLWIFEQGGDALLPPAWVVALALGQQGLRHLTVVIVQHPARAGDRALEAEARQTLEVDTLALRFRSTSSAASTAFSVSRRHGS